MEMDFTCSAGKTLVMIGPSGGGKTTIIRMLAGLEKPDGGEITFGGETWFASPGGVNLKPQKRMLGYVFQDYTLFPHLSLYENAAMAAADKREVDELLDLFGIGHLRNQKPDRVSGGERQRCAICQALARHPRILLLDEPFSALDVIARRALREEVKLLKDRMPCPIIYVTHDIHEALYLADEILPVVDGRVDRTWMRRNITGENPLRSNARATRAQRLALIY